MFELLKLEHLVVVDILLVTQAAFVLLFVLLLSGHVDVGYNLQMVETATDSVPVFDAFSDWL